MEFSLKNKAFEYMGAVYKNSFTREETTESIIPDSLPDVQRVIETEAMVCLRNKEADNGRVTISGVADVSVIYADEEGRIRRIAIGIPFNASEESGNIKSGAKVVALVKAVSADTRMLNPRKLLIRCDVLIDAACYMPKEVNLNLPPENMDDTFGVQMLTQETDVCVLTDVSEKTFVLREEYSLPPSKPLVGEVLRTKLQLEPEEAKGVGNKVILKGTVKAWLLYRPEKGGEPVNAEFSTVFSQIMELGAQSEGLDFKALLVPTSVYFDTDSLYSADDRRIILEAHMLAQCLAYRRETVSCIADAYCSKYEMSIENAEMEMESAGETVENVELIRALVEVVGQPGNIISVSVIPGVVYKNREGEKLEVKTTALASVLYISEDGVLLSASKKISVSSMLPWAAGAEYAVSAMVQGEPLAVISTDGIELKVNLAFKAECIREINLNGVSAINVDAENPKDLSVLPSLVVKRFSKGDCLWSLAKKYCSVADMILKANGIEAEPEEGTMLIIPKVR